MIRIGLDQTGNCQVPELPEDVNYPQKFALTNKNLLLPGQGRSVVRLKEIFRQQRSDENKDKRDRIEKVKSNILGFLCYKSPSHNQWMSQINVYKNNPGISILLLFNMV